MSTGFAAASPSSREARPDDPARPGLLDRARALHDAGRLDEALPLYDAWLATTPDDPEALHLMGVLHFQAGRVAQAEASMRRALDHAKAPLPLANLGSVLASTGRAEEALRYFDAALALEPFHLHALVRRGNVLIELGRFDEALASYDRALAIEPRSVEAWCNRGNALRETGMLAAALDSYERALACAPGHPFVLLLRGAVLAGLDRTVEALASFDEAFARQPGLIDAGYNSALALERLARYPEALARCDRVLALVPEHAAAHATRGAVLHALGRMDEALASYDRALAIAPDLPAVLCNRGSLLRRRGRVDASLADYEHALVLQPALLQAQLNRGNVLLDLNRLDDARRASDALVAAEPRHALAWFNRGNLLDVLGRRDDALAAYGQALALDPDYADAHSARSFVLLRAGRFAEGWPEYEWRWRDPAFAAQARTFAQPRRQGEPLDGRTILLHAEQGFGDTVQFCRFAAQVRARGARVVLEVQPEVHALLASLDGVDQLLARGEPLPPFDCQCPLLSVPAALRTELASVPTEGPYLVAPEARRAAWRMRLGPAARLRVGLAWAGDPIHLNDRQRSLPLAALAELFALDVDWISLQARIPARDAEAFAASPLRDCAAELHDFADTAALIDSLDLVVSVDTAVAHVAGALGRPVWILLPLPSDWRWLDTRTDSPWYASARLFRQAQARDWAPALAELAQALAQYAAAAAQRAC